MLVLCGHFRHLSINLGLCAALELYPILYTSKQSNLHRPGVCSGSLQCQLHKNQKSTKLRGPRVGRLNAKDEHIWAHAWPPLPNCCSFWLTCFETAHQYNIEINLGFMTIKRHVFCNQIGLWITHPEWGMNIKFIKFSKQLSFQVPAAQQIYMMSWICWVARSRS